MRSEYDFSTMKRISQAPRLQLLPQDWFGPDEETGECNHEWADVTTFGGLLRTRKEICLHCPEQRIISIEVAM